jgi:hypothetical protein
MWRFASVRHEQPQCAAAWRDILPQGEIGIDDDSFELGGTSILPMQLQRAEPSGRSARSTLM